MGFISGLISNAKGWLDCAETRDNRSVCVDKIHKTFAENWTGAAEPWCAKFVWVVFQKTCEQFGISNPLPHTPSTHELLKLAGSRFVIDEIPAVGSIMFYSTGNNTGHVGLVIDVRDNNFYTIDGNSSDKVKINNRPINAKNYKFIHTEQLFKEEIFPTNFLGTFVLISLLGYAGWKYLKK